jgi:hypothetical protein
MVCIGQYSFYFCFMFVFFGGVGGGALHFNCIKQDFAQWNIGVNIGL